ncbi:MAG: SAM-dependent methyltransferase [Archaeoglobaceae archaeon]|nr:23S rRNA (uridine(2552)-2'-O)-methyltransferase [Archaeoglobaceae archaeon]MDW7989266.1 SAM-dependent methyltransferase [Archaeoglobaceae archaeon]
MKDKRDHYYWEAKKKGYRSRAAFKLLQINRDFKLIRKGDLVLDLGSSPGGWSQVAVEIGAFVVAVDINPMEDLKGVTFIKADIMDEKLIDILLEISDSYDVVMSDASPKITGIWTIDHLRSIDLARASFNIAKKVLRNSGNFLVKVFQGEEIKNFYDDLKPYFAFKKFHSPKASRKSSAEIYFVGKGFKKI